MSSAIQKSSAIAKTKLLASKTRVPPPRQHQVPRPRLFARLEAAVERPLTLVSAPAGFGKSTLLSTWIPSTDRRRFAWLSLDQDDNDRARFISYVIAALEFVVPGFGKSAYSLLGAPQPLSTQDLMTLLLNELADQAKPIILVLDDYHLVSTEELDAAIVHAVDHMPRGLRFVLCTRQTPRFPFAKWRAMQRLAEIEVEDLRFSDDETALFLRQTMELPMDSSATARLAERTEGWVAGLQLAALSLHAHIRVHGPTCIRPYLDRFNGSDRFILDYIADIVQQQPEVIRSFLFSTAILDRLCPSLCNAVTGAENSDAILADLERNNLFVNRLDDHRCWYRYHQLFLDYLRAQPQEDSKERHCRAKVWYEQQGFGWEAVNHALAAEDIQDALRLLRENVQTLCCRGEFSTVLKTIDRLPERVVLENGDISGFKAWILYLQGAAKQSEAYAELALGAQTADTPLELRGTLLAFQAFLGINRGKADQAVLLAKEALSCFGSSPSFFRCCALSLLGHAYRQAGDQMLASEVFRQAVELGLEHGNMLITLDALAGLTTVMCAQGHLREAFHLCNFAIENFVDSRGKPVPACGLVFISRGLLRFETNDFEAADKDLRLGIALCEQIDISNFTLMGLRTQARVLFDIGDREAAWNTLTSARRLAAKSESPHRLHLLEAVAAEFNLREGNLAAAERAIGPASDLRRPASEYERLVYARVCLARGHTERAEEVLEHLERDALRAGRYGGLIGIYVQQALARRDRLDVPGALHRLEKAVSLAAPENYRHSFIDGGQPITELLSRLRGVAPLFVSSVVKEIASFYQSRCNSGSPAGAHLSATQRRIMMLLAAGLTNQEIADKLKITVGTAKWHLNQIFGKLEVRNRTEAVALARQTGLLA